MGENTAKKYQFDWSLPTYSAIGGVIVFLPLVIYGNNIAAFLYILVAAPIVGLALLIIALRKMRGRGLSVLSMLAVHCIVSWALFRDAGDIRNATRWFLWSKRYKAKVLEQAVPAGGALRHVEWDGWGFPGAGDTVAYFVFDPGDSLLSMAKNQSPGRLSGLPCQVSQVHRFEKNWYSVVFYSDTNWDQCN